MVQWMLAGLVCVGFVSRFLFGRFAPLMDARSRLLSLNISQHSASHPALSVFFSVPPLAERKHRSTLDRSIASFRSIVFLNFRPLASPSPAVTTSQFSNAITPQHADSSTISLARCCRRYSSTTAVSARSRSILSNAHFFLDRPAGHGSLGAVSRTGSPRQSQVSRHRCLRCAAGQQARRARLILFRSALSFLSFRYDPEQVRALVQVRRPCTCSP